MSVDADQGDDAYLDKSPNAGRMGKAAEYLVAAFCILATSGELNVSTSMVDDEGVDLVFHRRGGTATLGVQVKARMSTSKRIQSGTYMAFVQAATFAPRANLDMLFVAIDVHVGVVMQAWLVPSVQFDARKGNATTTSKYRFRASMAEGTRDQWRPFRLEAAELPTAILARLRELDGIV